MFFEDDDVAQVYCPGCKAIVKVFLADSLNFGNIVALCDPADHEFAYSEIDHKAIRAEARRGW